MLNTKTITGKQIAGIAAAGLVLGLIVGAALVRVGFVRSGRVASGVTVGDVELGGCATRAEAARKLAAWSHDRGQTEVTFVVGGKTWKGRLGDIGVIPDLPAIEHAVFSVGRQGNIIRELAEQFGWSPRARTIVPSYKLDRDKLDELFAKIDKSVAEPAVDARISFTDGVRSITPEKTGTSVDSEQSYKLVESAVSRGETNIELSALPKEPSVRAADLEQVDTPLATFTTNYPAWRKERTHNIKLAVSSVDGELLKPGEVFSYNKAVGPRLKKFGFEDAMIYVKGKIIPGTGGGICQVSSTVYNAALLAGLRIVERSHHSMKVPYVPLGRDATVAYGLLDLKFENNTSAPVYISAHASRSRLTVQVYGAQGAKKDVKIVTTRPKKVQRPNGMMVTSVTVYRVVNENGIEVRRERVSSDRYNPAPPHDAAAPKPKITRAAAQG